MPGFPTLKAPLADGEVRLRDYAERDIPDILIAYEDDATLHRRLGQERPPSGAQLGRWAETEAADRLAGAHATLTIVSDGSDVCTGQVTVHHVDWDHARAQIGLWVAPGARGRGVGRRALRLAATWLLRECRLERVELVTEVDNQPMLHTARAAGFIMEGVLRGYLRVGGRREDNAILSLLPTDLGP